MNERFRKSRGLFCTVVGTLVIFTQGCGEGKLGRLPSHSRSFEAQIREELVAFEPSADEVRVLIAFRKEQVAVLEELDPAKPSDERAQLRAQLGALEERLRRDLGHERYNFYTITQSPGYREAYKLVKKYDLPASTLGDFLRLRHEIRTRAASTKGLEEFELARYARRELVRLFGEAGYSELKPHMVFIFDVPFVQN